MSKTNGARNRAAGNGWELASIKRLKEVGYKDICSTRSNSRVRDGEKVDVMFKDEAKYGRFPYNLQCKNVSKSLDYAKLLAELPQDSGAVNVIFHKQTKKAENGRFMKVGEYAILELDDFYNILKRVLELEDEVKAWSNIM